jgi:hypothetical protein
VLTPTGPDSGTITAPQYSTVQYSSIENPPMTVNTGPADGVPDVLVLSADGPDDRVTLNGVEVFRAPLASIAKLFLRGSTDNDTFIVDFSGGNPIPIDGLVVEGGGGTDKGTVDDHTNQGAANWVLSGAGG